MLIFDVIRRVRALVILLRFFYMNSPYFFVSLLIAFRLFPRNNALFHDLKHYIYIIYMRELKGLFTNQFSHRFFSARNLHIKMHSFSNPFFTITTYSNYALVPVHTGSHKARQAAINLYVLYRTSDRSILWTYKNIDAWRAVSLLVWTGLLWWYIMQWRAVLNSYYP